MWTRVTEKTDPKLKTVVDLQRAQSPWYAERIALESAERRLEAGQQNLQIWHWEDENYSINLIVKESIDATRFRLLNCGVLYTGRESPHLAAVTTLTKLKELAAGRMAYAVWDDNNPEVTLRYFNAVANDANAKLAGWAGAETTSTPSITKDKVNYETHWKV